LYRRQAFWLGTISVLFAVISFLDYFGAAFYFQSSGLDVIVTLSQNATVIVAFFWIDSSILVGRRSDPLLRDTIRWSRLRYLPWALMLGGEALVIGYVISQAVRGTFGLSGSVPPLIFASLGVALVTPFLSTAVAVPLTASRSRDPIFRKHLRWLGLVMFALALLAVQVLVPIANGSAVGAVQVFRAWLDTPQLNVLSFATILVATFAFFKGARSLAPTSTLPSPGAPA
jgi:hypothetical protein